VSVFVCVCVCVCVWFTEVSSEQGRLSGAFRQKSNKHWDKGEVYTHTHTAVYTAHTIILGLAGGGFSFPFFFTFKHFFDF
jgi:hypothetical protein